ncbi:MAG TPA: aminoacyl-histidine dipeptidase [Candidatus Polarisedimenticolaceae bacterium]
MSTLAALEPRSLWEHFDALTKIPRPSGREAAAAAYVESVARRIGAEIRRDAVGNVVLSVPASSGREKAPAVILQGHLDMVAEKNKGVEHDFLKDPIRTRVEGEWVGAVGTTLGADNGIGVAAALAAATDPAVSHGPLELLFTIDEERGLTGAIGLDASLLRGRTLLNLDSEEDGAIYVGCSGGCDSILHFDPRWTAPTPGRAPLLLEVRGLRGGHSGLNIHEGRGNALKLVVRILFSALEAGVRFDLAAIRGGSKHNAIPREAEAILHVDPADRAKLDGIVACMREGFGVELAGVDDGVEVAVSDAPSAARVASAEAAGRLVRLLAVLPHGVIAMSRDLPGLVETSNNLAVAEIEGDLVRIVTSSRSSVAPSIRMVLDAIRCAGQLAGADVESRDGYPGWKPNLASPALGVVRDVYRRRWGREPEVKAIHAGLECGLLGEKVPGLDMVSFGPQIEGAHSPDERVHVASVDRFWGALKEVLDRMSA